MLHTSTSATHKVLLSFHYNLFTTDQWKNKDFIINLPNALFQSQTEALTISSELDKTLQPTHFIP